ncbi:MAG: MATE family efflux transporter, partial [Lachnospiraceae bacterium]|nr:MATE family efflux transporter [Lachnospiraceae bacterium]
MKKEIPFYKVVMKIAIPVTLQSLLQSSFSVVDQIMTGQLGSTNIAGIGLGAKFSSIFSVLVSAVAVAAGIMIAQYIGKKDMKEVSRSFFLNIIVAMALAVLFTLLCILFPAHIMGIYTNDTAVKKVAAKYLIIVSASFIPIAACTLFSTLMRCIEAAHLPLYAGIASAVINTGLNYVLIFGNLGFPKMGVTGAALATVISQILGCILTIYLFFRYYRKKNLKLEFVVRLNKSAGKQYISILLPILTCEFLWSLGENVYTGIYGHIGTADCAAMTLTVPVQVLFIGALSGVSQAAGILIGKYLGSELYDKAYTDSKKLMLYGLYGSIVLSVVLILVSRFYVQIYNVGSNVKDIAVQILIAFAVIAPVKVQNMILGGGIIRSGGKTKYVMLIDFIGTWGFGVPLGLMAAFIWNLSIPYVYFILSLEECVRLLITIVVFRRKNWMISLK